MNELQLVIRRLHWAQALLSLMLLILGNRLTDDANVHVFHCEIFYLRLKRDSAVRRKQTKQEIKKETTNYLFLW